MTKSDLLRLDDRYARSTASFVRPAPEQYIELIRERIDAASVEKHETIACRRLEVEEEVRELRSALARALSEDKHNAEVAAYNGEPQPEPTAPAIEAELRRKLDELAALDAALRTSAAVLVALGEPVLGEAREAVARSVETGLRLVADSIRADMRGVRGVGSDELAEGWLAGLEQERRAQLFLGPHAPLDAELQSVYQSLRAALEGVERKLAGTPWEATAREPGPVGRIPHPGAVNVVGDDVRASQRDGGFAVSDDWGLS